MNIVARIKNFFGEYIVLFVVSILVASPFLYAYGHNGHCYNCQQPNFAFADGLDSNALYLFDTIHWRLVSQPITSPSEELRISQHADMTELDSGNRIVIHIRTTYQEMQVRLHLCKECTQQLDVRTGYGYVLYSAESGKFYPVIGDVPNRIFLDEYVLTTAVSEDYLILNVQPLSSFLTVSL